MKSKLRRGWWSLGRVAAVIVLCGVIAVVVEWQNLVRFAIVSLAASVAHVQLSLGSVTLGLDRATLTDIRVVSLQNEPIAQIDSLALRYNLRDLLPGGTRMFGLESIALDRPRLTIIRHADGSYNIPVPKLQPSKGAKPPPLIATGRIDNGSIEIIDRSPTGSPTHLYAQQIDADADISTVGRSHYTMSARYGQALAQLYPVHGSGRIDMSTGFNDQHWVAPALPIASALDFVLDSPNMRVTAGMLHDTDLRIFSIPGQRGAMQSHLVASGYLDGGKGTAAALAKPIDDVHGPIGVTERGLLTPSLSITAGGISMLASGGSIGLLNPRVRFAIRGHGEMDRLRMLLPQAEHLPMHGPLDFSLLAEGSATQPLLWAAVHSPRAVYGPTEVSDTDGLVAVDAREADIIDFTTHRGAIAAATRGRVGLRPARNAIEMLVTGSAPASAFPYGTMVLPSMQLTTTALATANDLKTIAVRGLLTGASPTESLDATFDVASNGSGTLGPISLSGNRGSLYARVALNQPHGASLALVDVRNLSVQPAHATIDTTLLGSVRGSTDLGATGVATVRSAWGDADTRVTLASTNGRLAGALAGTMRTFASPGTASFGASIAGTPAAPRLASAFVLADGRYRNYPINGNAGVVLANGTLAIRDAALQLGPAFLAADGTVAGLKLGALSPRYDLDAAMQTSDARALIAAVQPAPARLVQGSIDAGVHVVGSGQSPIVSGTIDVPEGSVNGLAFRAARAAFHGNPASMTVTGGSVVVGSTDISFDATASRSRSHVALHAPYANLRDFNDFFDTGDTLAGNGQLALAADLQGTQFAGSTGDAFLTGARFLRIDLGDVAARWRSNGATIAGNVALGSESGHLHVSGSVTPSLRNPLQSTLDLTASAQHMDLETWLPMLGLMLPATGRLDANASLRGRYPDLAMNLHAALFDGTAGPLPIQHFEITASGSNGRTTIRSALLEVPGLTTVASGSFGLHPGDRIDLTAHSTSTNLGTLLHAATNKQFDVAAAFDSMLRIDGTVMQPHVTDVLTLTSLRYGKITIPRIAGTVALTKTTVAVDDGEVDLTHGRVLLSALMPIHIGHQLVPAAGPIEASITADDLDASNILALLPKDTKATGRVDGRVNVTGTLDAPKLSGALTLSNGSFSGPIERSPIADLHGVLAFAGSTATLQDTHATIGGGALSAQGTLTLENLRSPGELAFNLQARADNVRLDMPAYFTGNLNAAVTLARSPGDPITLGGTVDVANARVPLSALYNPSASTQSSSPLPPFAFDNLQVAVGQNVRVQSGNVDVGGTGTIALMGTLASPKLSGQIRSTGGTLSFYRTFNLMSGTVSFEPSSGAVPDVNAVATTYVSNPQTAIRLHVTGPATNMNLALASDPPYSRQQILGILVGAQQFGAVQGVQSTGGSQFSLPSAASNLALGQLNTLFTRSMLQPLSSSVGSALGLSDFQITTDIQTGLGLNASRAIGKNVTASASQTIGYPRIQTFALESSPSIGTSLRLRYFQTQGPTIFSLSQPQTITSGAMNLNPITAISNIGGTSGVDFSYLRKFPPP